MAAVELDGTWALVTGGGTRLGAAIALGLAGAGCNLVVHYARSAGGAARVVDEARALGRDAVAVAADLTDRAAVHSLAEATRAHCGDKLGVLVHNAANFERVPVDQLAPEHWDRALALNATAPFLLTTALASSLAKARGSIVSIACVSAARPWPAYLPYSASKAALVNLTQGFAVALAPHVRANAIAPGTVLPPDDYDQAKRERIRSRVPLQRLGSADDIVRAVLFFATNDYVTGQVLAVDGGRSVT